MRAAVYQGPGGSFEVRDCPEPIPGQHQMLLKVERCGVCGTDIDCVRGTGIKMPAGKIMGHEFAGEIVALGPEVKRFRVGDRITAMPMIGCGACQACLAGEPIWCPSLRFNSGGFGQFVMVGEYSSVKLAENLSYADGALVEPLAVGLHGADLAEMEPGAKVLVMGAGAIGLSAIFWARRLGAGEIIAMARSDRRRELALKMGASGFISGPQDVQARVIEALGGAPDVVFDCIGSPGVIALAIDMVKPRGTITGLGNCMEPDSFVPSKGMMKEVRIQFSMTYGLSDFQRVVDVLAAGAAEPQAMVTSTITLDKVAPTFVDLLRGSEQCKVLIAPWERSVYG